MARLAILVNIEARSGKEAEVEALLRDALPRARGEAGTRDWQAFKSGPSTFGIFGTFDDESGRRACLEGQVLDALVARTEALLARPPQVTSVDLLVAG